jgi:hypothetical protein
MCDEYYDVPPLEEKDFDWQVISKPGACLEVKSGPMPPHFQAQITHNFRCPARPGGTTFWNWFKWKIRRLFS